MDARTQNLLRQWQETDDQGAQEAYLRQRLRARSISWIRIETAAYLGDPVCLKLLGEDALAYVPKKGISMWLQQVPCRNVRSLRDRVLLAAVRHSHEVLPADLERGVAAFESGDQEALRAAHEELAAHTADRLPELLDDWAAYALAALVEEALEESNRTHSYGIWAPPELNDGAGLEKRMREGVTAELLPSLLTEDCADPADEDLLPEHRWSIPDEHAERNVALQDERAARFSEGGEQLFVRGVMEPEHAAAVLAAVSNPKKKKPTVKDAAAAVEAYALARGWRKVRTSVVAPSKAKRVKIKKRSINFEFRFRGKWEKKVCHAGRETLLTNAGQWLLDAARAAV